MSDLDKIATPRGEGMSMHTLQPPVTVSAPGGGADFFGPSQPLMPVAPPEVAGRTWDFPTAYNLTTQPRAYEQIGFAELRALADCYDPVRLILERRKDQMCRLPWTLRYRHDVKSKKLSAHERSVLREVSNFIKNPCAEHTFRSWLRVLLEDLLVIDAPSIFCERNSRGDLVELVPTDGATIKLILDEHGRPPRPFPYDGGPINWLGRTITGAELDQIGARIVDGMIYLPAFQQVLKALPAVNLTTWDLVYRPLNPRSNSAYGCSPVQQLVTTISTAMRRQVSQLEYLREGNTPEGVFGLPDNYTVDQIQQFEAHWNNMLAGNLGRRRQIRFVAGKGNFVPFKEPPIKTEWDEWLVRIVCAAFSYPPAAFVTLNNRSTAEQHERQSEEEGLGPLQQWVAETINGILDREFPGEDIEFAWQESEEVDPVRESVTLTRYVDSGIMSRNEARSRLGLDLDPAPAANELTVKTAAGATPISQGKTTDDDAEKLAKGAIVMLAPADWMPVAKFSLGGTTYLPDIRKRQLLAFSEIDAALLEGEGWVRKSI